MSALGLRLRRIPVEANKRIFAALRSSAADTVVDLPVEHGDFASLRRHKHCLLVSYRRDGRPIAQPVWPGYDGNRVYVWTEVQAYKAKRLRRNPAALIAPCSFLGKPLGPPIAATARVLTEDAEHAHAEKIIRTQWGWKRRTFERISRPLTDVVYVELVPA
ncbi:hypothetical protein FAIPA1_540031 [Frankia sp. AiPs1]|uniref:PPOX class F420-dependent oxidoreductase n=1 Tax=Frankia sp. AiPa1 TaxID=573492 RepID=UPI00202B803C|nr:PPOX class F420-dependent oxidoreductase [Frankia sp. AiPa1]MCL9761014.1 PPOX class F420-dependent oxidoreductase [Frankia sp. AiPa1]